MPILALVFFAAAAGYSPLSGGVVAL